MPTSTIAHPPIVSREEWLAQRKKLLAGEKELTKHYDRVNAKRRRLSMVKVEKKYVFDGPKGEQNLKFLFDGRLQLIVYPLSLHVRPCLGQRLLRLHKFRRCLGRLVATWQE